jgi:hypothetical protein
VKDKTPVFPATMPWPRFVDFTRQNTRFDALHSLLQETKLPFKVVRLNGGKKPAAHFFISPAQAGSAKIVLVAHYDCVAGSPGANDNAAGVFILIETALKLMENAAAGWLIIFTDKEELESGESLRGQGSFVLADFFRVHSQCPTQFFIFDCCGSGDTLIISTTADYLLKTEKGAGPINIQNKLTLLRQTALNKANETMQKFLLLPAPFSDDAGFLRAGIAAQLITTLPAREASEFAQTVRKDPLYINALVNGALKKKRDQNLFPETWRIVNTPNDTVERLRPEHFGAMARFAAALCRP